MAEPVSKEALQIIKDGYKSRFAMTENPTALHLHNQMYVIHDELIRKAQKSNNPDEAFGLLKEASGIMKIVDHIKTQTGIELSRD